MSKLWDKIKDTAYIREEHSIPVPDHRTQRLSNWTYADMKREFKRSMEYFTEKGFPEECVFLAYTCVHLRRYFCGDQITVEAMTENVMANTIRVIKALMGNEKKEAPSRRDYEEQIAAYRSAETHGLILSPNEQAELDNDIETALRLIRRLEYTKPYDEKEDGITLDFDNSFGIHYSKVVKVPPPADSDKRLRERLSDRAYEMLTEYEREDEIVDLDFVENEVLKPNGYALTDKLREFVELYAGREYIWHCPDFFMDYPFSRNSYRGYSVDLYISWACKGKGSGYVIPAMQENVPPYTGPEVGSDGNIHFYSPEYWENYPDVHPLTPEEFFEREARERYRDSLLTERRRELENKYLIPAIRTAGI